MYWFAAWKMFWVGPAAVARSTELQNFMVAKLKVKDDFQSVLRSLRTLMFINIIHGSLDEMRIDVILKNHIPYLWDLSNSFSNSFIDFYSCEGFHQVIYQKEWSIKLRIDNSGWHETLNLLHVSRSEMLHFVTSYMKHNKLSRVRSSDWKSALNFFVLLRVALLVLQVTLSARKTA